MVHRRNVIIVAARRSGTHLLADLIVNNFEYESINKNYIDYTKFEHPGLNGFQELMDEGNKVTWTHSHNYKIGHFNTFSKNKTANTLRPGICSYFS